MAYGLVERRRRAVARVALYGSLALVGGLTFAGRTYLRLPLKASGETRWLDVDWKQSVPTRLLQQYVRMDTTEETGDPVAAALFLATPLEAAGLEVHVERVGPRQANVWAELPGEDPRALVLLSHTDVEAIAVEDRNEWEYPPFAGVLSPPWLHGRGTFDMKSYTVAQLLALLELKASGHRPQHSVIFLATSGEETGSDLGIRWFVREHPDLVRRFWAVMTEGGVVEARTVDDPKYWGTDVGEKRFVEVLACAPTRERLVQLREDLLQRWSDSTAVTVRPDVRRFWNVYLASRDLAELRRVLVDPDGLARDPARLLSLPTYLRAMLREDVVPFAEHPAPGGGGWQMRLLLHLLPGSDLEQARRVLLPDGLTRGVTLTVSDTPPPAVVSPLDHPVMRAVQAEVRARYPHVIAGPFFHPWTATDARFLRPLGIPSYGFSPFLILTPDTEHMHRANERIPLTTFVSGVELYEAVVRRLVASSG